ncbi:unnamed protein product [Gemmata massiliana]|uniref:Uncharacterized protein n=1 Tax=Gemmata massiliana TaxID=1210884 RepID=A0A6P2D4R6_9BACT|nr:helix-turn-helix domain-containing protein [Gemmata massiliana]VTR96063.1 unnamed protein product [Gemmata massiliana]
MPRKPPALTPIDPGPRELTLEEMCTDGALPIRAAAAFIGVGLSTMRQLVDAKEVPSLKVRAKVMVPKRALVLYLAKKVAA